MSKSYDRASSFYEKMAAVYSFGKIRESKTHGVGQMNVGDKVIFLGVGSGEDAIMAAQKGVMVTCVDISQGMLNVLERKLTARGLNANLICQDARTLDCFEQFDACAANYFLNVFVEKDMKQLMQHAASLVRSGGKFLIADVSIPQGNIFYKTFNYCYLKWAMVSTWMLGLVPLHENYDYVKFFEQASLELDSVTAYRFFGKGPIMFQSIVATKR